MRKEEVRLVVAYKINEYELFEKVAKKCSEYVASNEAGTLVYDWYVAEDKLSGKLFEVYKNAEALESHLLGAVFQEIGPKFKNSITWNSIESFGCLPEAFHKILGGLPNAHWGAPEIGT